MTGDVNLIGDSSMHHATEAAPHGGFYRHRLTIRFTNGETFVYTVREALHAEDISSSMRFAVITSYQCDVPEQCDEVLLLNLNDVSYIKTEHVTEEELKHEELSHGDGELQLKKTARAPQRLSHIGFI